MDFNLWMQPQYFSHFREYTRKEYEKILLNSGFTSVKSSLRLDFYISTGKENLNGMIIGILF